MLKNDECGNDKNGKILKGANYFRPNLKQYLKQFIE